MLFRSFTGGRSVIGGFIDEMFGVGTAAEVVNDLKGRFEEFMYFVRLVKDEIMALWDAIHIGYNARTDPRNQASRTPIRQRGVTPADVRAAGAAPGASPGVGAVERANAARALREALGGRPGAFGVSVPVQTVPAPGRGRGGPGITVPAPGGGGGARVQRTEIQLHSQPRLQLTINNPTGNGAEIGRAAQPAIRRALADGDRDSIRALQDSGLVTFQTGERDD